MVRTVLVSSALALGVMATPSGMLHAQQAAPASAPAQAPATPADVAAVVGDWTLNMDTPMGPMATMLSMRVDAGKVAADVSNDMMGKSTVSEVLKKGATFVLTYSMDMQGQAIPVVLTLTPKGEGLTASFDFGGGQFQMDGVGTRTKK
jgi:hypothetical protein